ncbi:rod shape-determining protein MreC [Alkalithermobacter thermoalcaliphilus JW-YL-7 = DSM 7308]|uniref:Cell shape-determining protein MreC n=1 Tax=Alkalithermobacter thermoalcaliphilus JW-YL-7 = DSM 7308 TaxID=1121328 RepID=A0A150FSL3_CLOPD|nr:rod shape-determining protein MreC [[Clostridium] paradoxum JW-YL-7 = DSM 7308]SHK44494.1 rod shape-determining protein MreC [[Clostridium] paradoxum JW-YL-7 = DSM 7308]
MSRRKRKKKKTNTEVIAFILIAITLIVIIGISSLRGTNNFISSLIMDISSPISRGVNKVFTVAEKNIIGIMNYKKNLEIIDNMKKENQELRQKIIEIDLKRSELESLSNLRRALNFVEDPYEKKYIGAKVVSRNDGNWYTSFTIAAGKSDGVTKNSIVVSGDGLVGIVYEVSNNYSKAMSILNNKTAVSFEILRKSEYTGVLSQNISIDLGEEFEEGYLKGYLFDSKYEVVAGDVLITSGVGLYPKGIPIGQVDKVIEDRNNLLKYIKVKPYANLKKLDKVLVVPPRKIN